jgi:UDP-N-acetylglucosamine--N-acetylmuramyl-(pentapeptide) pyrophosphoryl-undecaprenol N-acetylglucosamine transferase
VLIAGSGTGGHLFPALHIARALKEANREVEVLFVGSGRPLEATILDPTGFRRTTIPTVGLRRRGVRGAWQWARGLPRLLGALYTLFREFSPDLVIGVGGYASVGPVVFGRLTKRKTWIHEAERSPGLANLFLSLVSHRVSLSVEQCRMPFWARTVFTGHPVRQDLFDPSMQKSSLSCPPRILILGGSQGARSIDTALGTLASRLAERNIELLHQARKDDVDEIQRAYASALTSAKVVSFIDDMASAFKWSDIVITRSGAGAISELKAVGRPGIVIPLPNAVEQRENAEAIAKGGVVTVVADDPSLATSLLAALDELLIPEVYQMRARLSTAAQPSTNTDKPSSHEEPVNAALAIACGALSLLTPP